MKVWVLASSNTGKLAEFQHALAPVLSGRGIRLINQSDLGISAAEEPFATFEGNALAKARHASHACGHPAIADDSGFCVDALKGGPGVRSARYFSDAKQQDDPAERTEVNAINGLQLTTDAANLRWLLHQAYRALGIADAPRPARPISDARFVAAMAMVRFAEDPEPIVVRGTWQGQLYSEPLGDGGFGYDPLFFDPNLGLTAAQMSLDQKRAVSHRGKALDALLARLA